MPVLTSSQIATLQRVLATTNNVLPRLEMLEALARINVAIAPRVQELRQQREYLAQLATAALEIDRQLGGTATPTPVQQTSGVAYSPPPPSMVRTDTYTVPPPPPAIVMPSLPPPPPSYQQAPDVPMPNSYYPVADPNITPSLSSAENAAGYRLMRSGNGYWYKYNVNGLPV